MASAAETITAADYAASYRQALEAGTLRQGVWNSEEDGRYVACALGVIGKDVDSPAKCPAQIMPRWLAQMVPAFFDRQKAKDAYAWGLGFTAELERLNGNVPFSVIHDWHANTVCVLGIDAADLRKRDTAPHKALQTLHLRALSGEKIRVDEWRPVLKNAYADANANANANAYANAYAYANANAYANADANAYAYADANANAYANAYADANANANANAYANAYADANANANANAYANAYAYANANAYADADANAYAYADANAWKRLADGMTAALSRVEA